MICQCKMKALMLTRLNSDTDTEIQLVKTERQQNHTTSASILASITVDGAYLAAYPYIRAKAAWISSESSIFLVLSEKKFRNLKEVKLHIFRTDKYP